MSEKQTGNDIDEIFRKGIENLNTEPSDEFWRKTAESIIEKGKPSSNKNASRWRALALFLGAVLLVLGYFTIKMQTGLGKAAQKMADVKNSASENVNVPPVNSSSSGNAGNNDIASTKNNGNSRTTIRTTSDAHKLKNIVRPTSPYLGKTVAVSKMQSPQLLVTRHNRKPGTHKTEPIPNTVVAAISSNEKAKLPIDKPESNSPESPVISNIGNQTELKSSVQNPAPTSVENPKISFASNQTGITNSLPIEHTDSLKKTQIKDTAIASSRFSIFGYFSPDVSTGYNYKSTGTRDNQYTGEKEQFSYSAGVELEYALSSHFSIGVGLGYQTFHFQITPEYLYAQKQTDGQVGYSIVSSSGIIDCPSYGNTRLGDSMKMSAISSRSYLSIPVQLKYLLFKTNNVQIYILGSAGINILTNAQTQMTWQSYQAYGVSTISGAEGLQPVYYSCSFGAGLSHSLSRHLAINFEINRQLALTSINKNTPLISYPYIVGLNLGATYHF